MVASFQDQFTQMEFSLWHLNEIGNEMFQLKKYDDALIKFNESFQSTMVLSEHYRKWQREHAEKEGFVHESARDLYECEDNTIVSDACQKSSGEVSLHALHNDGSNSGNTLHRVSVSSTSATSISSFDDSSFEQVSGNVSNAVFHEGRTTVARNNSSAQTTGGLGDAVAVTVTEMSNGNVESMSKRSVLPAPQTLLQPLKVHMLMVGSEEELFQLAEEWISVALITVMYNGALCHYMCGHGLSHSNHQVTQANSGYKNANALLSFALQVHDELDFDEFAVSEEDVVMMETEEDVTIPIGSVIECSDGALVERNNAGVSRDNCDEVLSERHRISDTSQVALFSIRILKAKLLEENILITQKSRSPAAPTQENKDESDEDRSQRKQHSKLVEDCIHEYADALIHAESLWGGNHLLVAAVYSGMGRILLREGYIHGAILVFQAMDSIYNIPRVSEVMGEGSPNVILDGSSYGTVAATSNFLSDAEFASFFLGNLNVSNQASFSYSWVFAAAAA